MRASRAGRTSPQGLTATGPCIQPTMRSSQRMITSSISDLTLNLGLRYEYFSPPYLGSGLTVSLDDLGNGMFGASRGAGGKLFDNWLQPGNLFLTNYGKRAARGRTSRWIVKPGVRQSPLLPVSTCDPNTMTTLRIRRTGHHQSGQDRYSSQSKPILVRQWVLPGRFHGLEQERPRCAEATRSSTSEYAIREDVLAPLRLPAIRGIRRRRHRCGHRVDHRHPRRQLQRSRDARAAKTRRCAWIGHSGLCQGRFLRRL